VMLERSDWSQRFDPETWVERWYRAGHMITCDPRGRPMLMQRMDADEETARRLRIEAGDFINRAALLGFLNSHEPARVGTYSVYARRRT
ncbi:MAG TPA: hypothetical protein VF695_02920, partial [Sphingomonas sp.]